MTKDSNIKFRSGTIEDCYKIAQLIEIANSGVEIREWRDLCSIEEPQVNGGAIHVSQLDHDYNYKNTIIAEQNSEIVGIALCYKIKSFSQEEIKKQDVLNQTYAKLKQQAVGDYYIDSLACFPEFRGKGIGSQLIEHVKKTAVHQKYKGLCLLAYEINSKAIKLYKRHGFSEKGRLPLPNVPALNFGGDIILFSKNL